MRRTIPLVALIALVLTWCGGGAEESQSTPQSGPGNYEGPAVSFDYPNDWHEFNLKVGYPYFAAYGPIDGGDDDFVAISAEGPETEFGPPGRRMGPMEKVHVNGIPGYSVPLTRTLNGQALEGEMTLVGGNYIVWCQYGEHMSEQVPIGCEMLKDTLVETSPPPITDPSGCTDAALELLQTVPMPQGVLPSEELEAIPMERKGIEYLACDLMVYRADLAFEHAEGLIAYFRSRLTEAGWRVRTAPAQVLATRDFDTYYIEVHSAIEVDANADPDQLGYFFVTAWDG